MRAEKKEEEEQGWKVEVQSGDEQNFHLKVERERERERASHSPVDEEMLVLIHLG